MGQVTITLTGDEARAIRALDRTQQKLRELGEAGKRTGEETSLSFNKVANSLGRAFGAGALGTLGPWALAIKGIQEGLNLVAEAYKDVEKAQEAAAKNALERGGAVGKLGKYAGGNRDTMAQLSQAQALIARESGFSEEESAKIVGEMAEGGYRGGNETAIRRAYRLKKLGFEHAGKSAMALSHMEGGTLGRASALAGATKFNDTEGLIEGTDELRDLAKETGVSETELMASIASAGQSARSTKTGTSQIKALLGGLKARGYKGSLEDAVKKLGGIKTSDKHLEELVGGKEGLAGLRALQAESGRGVLKHTQFASDDDFFGLLGADEDVRAATSNAAAKGEERDAQKEVGARKARADAERARLHAEDLRDNGGEDSYWSQLKDWNRRNTPDWRMDPGDKAEKHLERIADNTRPKTQTVFHAGPDSDPGK